MEELNKIVSFLDEYLDIDDIEDHSFNGLQFEGKSRVEKVGFMVDSGIESLRKAINNDIDLLVVHHGIFWKGLNPSIKGVVKNKFDLLYSGNMSLYAAHLPLDRHRDIGNNAQIIYLLGGEIDDEFVIEKGKNIGWIGKLKKRKDVHDIKKEIDVMLNTETILIDGGRRDIKRIGVCSGGGTFKDLFEGINKNIDLFITGDRFDAYHISKDYKINVMFSGHYATETTGVKALMKVIREKFKVDTKFIDVRTGL